jgi:hypothetical protein
MNGLAARRGFSERRRVCLFGVGKAASLALCGEHDGEFGDEQDHADGKEADADGCGPGALEVSGPIECDQHDADQKEEGTAPTAKASGDLAFPFVLEAADLAQGLTVILAIWFGPAVEVNFGPPERVLGTLRGWGNGSVAG